MAGQRTRQIIGLMSGTSCDGVDAVLTAVRGRGLGMRVQVVAHAQRRYPKALRQRVLTVMAPAETTTQEICRLGVDVAEHHARAIGEALDRADMTAGDVVLIGSHGQTICHLPPRRRGGRGSTLQIGDAAVLAARSGIPVVSDFRRADVALGGQGAPLVPWTDYVLYHQARRSRIVQNIGGIANVTYLSAGGEPADVIAFDTGPGNMVIDELVRRATKGRLQFDRDGRRAARGRVDQGLLKSWLGHPFFRRKPPKSCGREAFGSAFVDEAVTAGEVRTRPDDLIATATALTARSIAEAYRRFLPRRDGRTDVDEVIVCGGGARNATLLGLLRDELPGVSVTTIDRTGIGVQAKEAVSFAMLAAACVDGVPANLPQVTGASGAAILGRITPIPQGGPERVKDRPWR